MKQGNIYSTFQTGFKVRNLFLKVIAADVSRESNSRTCGEKVER